MEPNILQKLEVQFAIELWIAVLDCWKLDPITREINPDMWSTFRVMDMNIFTACEVFFQFMEAKPCHVH